MNNRPRSTASFILLLMSGLLPWSATPANAQKSLPVTPEIVLSLLPDTPPGLEKHGPWKLAVSRARQEIEVDWLVTRAERIYEQARPSPETETKPPRITIRLLDTGGYDQPLQMFGPQPLANPRRDREVQSFPAIQRKAAAGSERVVILVGARWLVDVVADAVSAEDLSALLKELPLAQLAAVRTELAETLPSELSLEVIDELNPAANSTRKVAFMTQADRLASEEAYTKFLEAPPENMDVRRPLNEAGR